MVSAHPFSTTVEARLLKNVPRVALSHRVTAASRIDSSTPKSATPWCWYMNVETDALSIALPPGRDRYLRSAVQGKLCEQQASRRLIRSISLPADWGFQPHASTSGLPHDVARLTRCLVLLSIFRTTRGYFSGSSTIGYDQTPDRPKPIGKTKANSSAPRGLILHERSPPFRPERSRRQAQRDDKRKEPEALTCNEDQQG